MSKAALERALHTGKGTKRRKRISNKNKIEAVLAEFKRGTLRSGGSGDLVTDRKQALAIAMSEAGLSKKKKRKPRQQGGGLKG